MTEVVRVAEEAAEPAGRRPRNARRGRSGWLRPGAVAALMVVSLMLLWALAPSWFADQDPLTGVTGMNLQPPGPDHLFGTDQLGRDVLARTVHGTRLSLVAALLSVAISFGAGSLSGTVAGYLGGLVDDVVMRAVDVVLSIPGLLLSMMLITILGFGTTNVAIAVGVAGIPGFARITRGEVLRVRTADYVEASTASGVRWYGVLGRHVLPNSVGPALALATLELGTAVLAISAMSFLGYGATPPTPEWGTMIADGRDHLATAWWITTMPGLVVVAVVLAFSQIGRTLDARRWGQA